jgi:uncharacterized membrane protein YccC
MSLPSFIFYAIFLAPMVAFFIWLMRQDKKKGAIGIAILAVMVVGGIIYMYWRTRLLGIDQ